jgi:hypothetical protein
VERIGLAGAVITHKVYRGGEEETVKRNVDIPDHRAGLLEVNKLLTDPALGVIGDPARSTWWATGWCTAGKSSRLPWRSPAR